MSELKGLDCEIAFSEMEVFADAAISMNNSNAVCFIKKRFISAI
jgi:hypothetical protein